MKLKILQQHSFSAEDLDEAAECLMEAEAIKKNPELLKAVQQHAMGKEKRIKSLQDIRTIAHQMSMSDEQKEEEKESEEEDAVKDISSLRKKAKEKSQ